MNWINYLVEANLYLAAFYALYLLFLRSETHYQLNRAYLLGTSALAFVIPFLQLGILKPVQVINTQISVGSISGGYGVAVVPDAPVSKWTMDNYILLIYGLVAIAFLVSLGIRVYLLKALLKKGTVTKNADFNIIELHQGSVAFSFFNNLFIDDRLASSQTVLYHEQVHIRQKHSWDIIYLELLKIINWFNPAIYLLIASIKELHEFIADEETAGLENNNDSYTDFLISNAYGVTQNSLTNSFFNKNLLKRRITMLYQKRSGKAARLKYLLTLPLLCGLLCASTLAFTTKTYGLVDLAPRHAENRAMVNPGIANTIPEAPVAADLKGKTTQQVPADAQKEDRKGLDAVESMASFPGGVNAFRDFLAKNVHYPAIDKEKKVEGKVYVAFVVERDGSVTDVRIRHSPSETLAAEAMRVIKLSPKWEPAKQNGKTVRTELTAPVNFYLDKKTAAEKLKTTPVFIVSAKEPGVKVKFPPPVVKPDKPGAEPPPPPAAPGKPGVKFPPPIVVPDKIFTSVDVQPEFPGGQVAFSEFLTKNIHYPAVDKNNNVQGKVFVTFVVQLNGLVTDAQIAHAPSATLGIEALRVISQSPRWIPGKKDGKPVSVKYTVPVNFSLGDGAPPPSPPDEKGNPGDKVVRVVDVPLSKKPGENAVRVFDVPLSKTKLSDNPNAVYSAVDVNPEFPDGEPGFGKFLQKNIRYPLDDKKNKVQGKVYATFVVEKDGSLTDIKIVRTPSPTLGEEVLRVMKLSPKWIPGKLKGEPARVQYTVPVNFSLGDGEVPRSGKAQAPAGTPSPDGLSLNGVSLVKEGADFTYHPGKKNALTQPLIVINGDRYHLRGNVVAGQQIKFAASGMNKYYTKGDAYAMQKWGDEAANGVLELKGEISMSIE